MLTRDPLKTDAFIATGKLQLNYIISSDPAVSTLLSSIAKFFVSYPY